MGLGWDAGCDLDAWCYMYSADWFLQDEVGYSHLQSKCKRYRKFLENSTKNYLKNKK